MALCDLTWNLEDPGSRLPAGVFANRLYLGTVLTKPTNHKPRKPVLSATRIPNQLRERLRYIHYSLRTEQNYVYWARWFIRWHRVRHPRDMGGKGVESFLSMLANERKVAPSAHRQALSALLFLYEEVLDLDLPWMQVALPGVSLPFALEAKYPCAAQSWTWQWVFPSPTLSLDPHAGMKRPHFCFPSGCTGH